ncbi:MAG: YggS family pyridoxal phosphate-dependent enzyme [Candidatus Krumholzibacteria bacterium]|nr:YggS family pyridoxal phosphate-dependent enzyme [Candidatus Krumholzibacteria bacterium]
MSIAENLLRARERVAEAAVRAGRDPASVAIVAVTKTHPARTVEEALRAGVTDVGENRVQEFLEKAPAVSLPCRWHLVGTLQTNKVNKAVGRFALIHSVDSLRLAERLSAAGEREGATTEILVEVNTSGEASKHGVEPAGAEDLCRSIAPLPALRLRGLMTVGPWVPEIGVVARSFESLRLLRDRIAAGRIEGISMEHLSMGMSGDFETAIAEGATIVRLGRVIFGERRQG